MIDKNKLKLLANDLLPAIYEAGDAIMEVYGRETIEVEAKDNNSPVTEADQKAEAILLKALKRVAPEIPVVAEEQAEAKGLPKKGFREFFLVDPLDGTKEFIGKGTSFTVNIALIQNGKPIMGLVYAPAMETLFGGFGEGEAYKIANKGGTRIKISVRKAHSPLSLVASKSHRNRETEDYISHYPGADLVSIGSSLKFCLVAEGKADLYPRFGPTMEWDTAAGHAVLASAGGAVYHPDGKPFDYNKKGFRNGYFIAVGDPAIKVKIT